jgi:hypothetical protein
MVWWSKIEIIKLSAAALITAGLGGLIYWYPFPHTGPTEYIKRTRKNP